jgi:hypothetical protein
MLSFGYLIIDSPAACGHTSCPSSQILSKIQFSKELVWAIALTTIHSLLGAALTCLQQSKGKGHSPVL